MQIIGHRGASAHAPENTLAAINLAWKQGVDGVEIDVHLTKDGRLVAIHDETLVRVGKMAVRIDSLRFRQLQVHDVGSWKDSTWAAERVPSLASVIQSIPSGKRLLVEVKCGPEAVEAFASNLEIVADRPEAVTIIGFDLEIMAACKSRYPRTAVYLVAEQKLNEDRSAWEPTIDVLIKRATDAGLDGLDLSNTLGVTKPGVDAIHRAGLDCCIWTVNKIEDGDRLRDCGVDGITTDDPLLFVRP